MTFTWPSKTPPLPQGFVSQPDVLSAPAERLLLGRIRGLPLKEFEFHGFTAKRRTNLLRGPSRTEWEHSIPAVDALRYSITFRSLSTPKIPR